MIMAPKLIHKMSPEEVESLPAINQSAYAHAMQKFHEEEASRWKGIAQGCYNRAFKEGTLTTEDGGFEIIVSNADGERMAPDKDKFFMVCEDDAVKWHEWEMKKHIPDLTMTSLEKFAKEVKGLKGKAITEYAHKMSIPVGCLPSFRPKLHDPEEIKAKAEMAAKRAELKAEVKEIERIAIENARLESD